MTETQTVTERAAFARVTHGYYPILVAVFTATLIISNVCATKGVAFFADSDVSLGPFQILPINTDGAFFLFPLSYVIGDVLSEVYGFKATRRAIYIGFGSLLLGTFCFWLATELPAAAFYENQAAFETVLGVVPRLVLAGLAGYLVGQTLNSVTLVLIKERTREKHLWARLIGSTVVGEFGDTLIFCSIAAGAIGISTWSDFFNYLIVGFIWKTLVEIFVMPITYRVIAYIKKREPSYAPQPSDISVWNT
ncbi:queuosine precursor transporter [Aldersonia sp. NBC_00410]|uniref:queuosine precursor transporter n=1 Tax=Aldersonia sp. NBC_00410 TaxID=2975954 RepID=UPI0022541511|nr:queuosine precursor transporter [Aldersonia sp. NBC_00410]MCX5042109.1 queuosine precursor transporter [Aldersonia sp. NBC_00410]